MKKLSFFALGLSLLGLASCASDEPLNNNGSDQTSGVKDTYAKITINLPSAAHTRAIYDDQNGSDADDPGIYTGDGQEIGQDYENQVSKVLVVLATRTSSDKYELLTYAISDAKPATEGDKIEYVLNFSSSELCPKIADDKLNGAGNLNGKDVYVFAYCNPTESLENAVIALAASASEKDISQLEGSIASKQSETEIWKGGKFLMSNVKYVKVEGENGEGIPPRDKLVTDHNAANKAFDLGEVYVERAVARFDFEVSNDEGLDPNQYEVKDVDGSTRMGIVEFTDMAVFNISKTFYYLPRTNTQWDWGGTTTICSGKDNNTNAFVMSTNPDNFKIATNLNEIDLENYFFAPLNGSRNWQSLAKWNDRENDIDEGWPAPDKSNYKIWRYVTENTIPQWGQNQYGSQRAGITTGVAFRAKFTPSEQYKNIWNGNVIYVFKNTVYGDYNALVEYIKNAPDSEVAKAFNDLELDDMTPSEEELKKENSLSDGKDYENSGFSAYFPTYVGDVFMGYNMYYFYYNRHKSNGDNAALGINEFGVVRNNVYKLKITAVNSLGLPNPPDPNTEDEEEKVFFNVSVKVLPWVVRVNDIQF